EVRNGHSYWGGGFGWAGIIAAGTATAMNASDRGSRKEFIGLTWDDNGNRGGIALQAADKNFRGLLVALEGMSGKRSSNPDTAAPAVTVVVPAPPVQALPAPVQ